jgi:hypothetical protein
MLLVAIDKRMRGFGEFKYKADFIDGRLFDEVRQWLSET